MRRLISLQYPRLVLRIDFERFPCFRECVMMVAVIVRPELTFHGKFAVLSILFGG